MYRSPHPPLDLPKLPLVDFVLAGTARRGGRAALICAVTGRTITYAALRGVVDHTAAGLAALGIGKGDVCAVFAPNSPEYVIAVLAIARLGAIATTASPVYTKDDLKKQLQDSAARILFTSAALAPIWTEVIAGTAVERVVTLDPPGGAEPVAQPRGRVPFDALAVERQHSAARRDLARRRRRAAVLERHDRLAERRDADARESHREHPPSR